MPNKKIRLWLKFYVTMETKNRLSLDIPYTSFGKQFIVFQQFGWLVGFGFNGPLRQYFSLYRAVSQREGERAEKG